MMRKSDIHFSRVTILLIILVLLSGCTTDEIYIIENRTFTDAVEEEILRSIEATDFINIFYKDINRTKKNLIPTIKRNSSIIELPSPPLSYDIWESFFLNPARNKKTYYGTNHTSLNCSYYGSIVKIDNFSIIEFLPQIIYDRYPFNSNYYSNQSYPYGGHFVIKNDVNESYSVQQTNYSDFIKSFGNYSFFGYKVEQMFEYKVIGWLDISTLKYFQVFWVNSLKEIKLAVFFVYILASIY